MKENLQMEKEIDMEKNRYEHLLYEEEFYDGKRNGKGIE